MPDIADQANEIVELTDKFALLEVQSRKPEAEETGFCLLCGEELPLGRRWCDAEHRDRWEKERSRNGA
jgi:hypothetical protein